MFGVFMEQAFVGRQPIYRDGVAVFGYELFSRNNELNQPAFATGDTVAAEALLHEFMTVGLEKVVGPHPAFINVTRDFILNDYVSLLPKNGVVMQIGGDARHDDAMLKTVAQLSRGGYSFAVNNLDTCDDLHPVAEVANIVKLN